MNLLRNEISLKFMIGGAQLNPLNLRAAIICN